jgi:hypothetical protein
MHGERFDEMVYKQKTTFCYLCVKHREPRNLEEHVHNIYFFQCRVPRWLDGLDWRYLDGGCTGVVL